MVTYWVGIKSGMLSGAITGLIASIMISIFLYALSTSTSDSLTNLQIGSNMSTEFSAFGKTVETGSLVNGIIVKSIFATGLGIIAGILLGAATVALIRITRRGVSFSIALLAIIALLVYYSQTYQKFYEIITYLQQQPSIDSNLKIIAISVYIVPPILFALIEGILLKYFISTHTVVKFERTKSIDTDNSNNYFN